MSVQYNYEVQGYYCHGWEMVTTEDSFVAAKERLQEYRDNENGSFRIRRVKA